MWGHQSIKFWRHRTHLLGGKCARLHLHSQTETFSLVLYQCMCFTCKIRNQYTCIKDINELFNLRRIINHKFGFHWNSNMLIVDKSCSLYLFVKSIFPQHHYEIALCCLNGWRNTRLLYLILSSFTIEGFLVTTLTITYCLQKMHPH